MNRNEYCDGCLSYDDEKCPLFYFNDYGECPCTNCILKMICMKRCKELSKFENLAYDRMEDTPYEPYEKIL